MAVTFRAMMNRVLSNLSEDELPASQTEVTDTYQKLVRNFINHIKEEMEDAHNWRTLRSKFTVNVLASGESAAIAATNDRSRLVRIHDSRRFMVLPMCHSVTDADEPFRMIELDLDELQRRRREDQATEPQVQDSQWFALDQDDDGLILVVWPASTMAQTFELELVVPQERFVADATDLDSNISVPAAPLELGATWYSLEERGEELGVNSLFSEKRYRISADSAIARDAGEAGGPDLVAV